MDNLTCIQCKNWKTKDCIECVYCETYKDSNVLNIDTLKFNNYEQIWLSPDQYEIRTGIKITNDAALWVMVQAGDCGYHWSLFTFQQYKNEKYYTMDSDYDLSENKIAVVLSPEPPPYNFTPARNSL